jgi:hypothetical protein
MEDINMKIRTSFVSNSSSTSFCIFGRDFDLDIIREKFMNEEEYEDDISEILEDKLEGSGISFDSIDYEYNVTMGYSVSQLDKTKKLEDIAIEVADKLTKIGLDTKPEEVNFIHDGGYNG